MDTQESPITAPVLSTDADAPTLATAPTLTAIASGTVGNYGLLTNKKGLYRLRHIGTEKLVPEAFGTQADAAWYAQRLSRLDQVRARQGKLFMPKIVAPAGYSIVGEAGAYRVLDDAGEQVGPVWTHKTNGKVDAMRWAERVARQQAKGGAA